MNISLKNRFNLIQIIIVLFIYFLTSHVSAKNKKVILASDEWCPFFCYENNQATGILTELIKEALHGSNFDLEIKVINWARAVEMAKQGEISGLIGAYKDDVPNFLFSVLPPYSSSDCFYGLSNNKFIYQGIKSLNNQRVGIINSYGYGAEIDSYKVTEAGKKIFFEVSGEDPLIQNLSKLEAGRLDLIIENQAVINHLAKKNEKYKKITSKGCLKEKEVHIAFSPVKEENKEVVTLFSNYLKSKKGQKKINELKKKYQ